jgi:hypothetical protein
MVVAPEPNPKMLNSIRIYPGQRQIGSAGSAGTATRRARAASSSQSQSHKSGEIDCAIELVPTALTVHSGICSATELDLERHIRQCELLWIAAYQRFLICGERDDRAYAVLWLQRMNEAILARSPETQASRHAAFEHALEQGVKSQGHVLNPWKVVR